MLKLKCLIVVFFISIAIAQSAIIFDPKGVDIVHPVVSGCLPSDDFTKDINVATKFYRCANGVQNSMHCAPGTVFDGLSKHESKIVMAKQCVSKITNSSI